MLPQSEPRQVLDSALDLLLALCSADAASLRACCDLGFCPAVLRFALPATPLDVRLQAAAFAEVACRSSAASAAQLLACQGVPFLRCACCVRRGVGCGQGCC